MIRGVGIFNWLGIDFLTGGYEAALAAARQGKCLVFPAAPALATLPRDPGYFEALQQSDAALPDSGLMVLALRARGVRLTRLSGLEFLRTFLEEPDLRLPNALFLINPNQEENEANRQLLRQKGIHTEPEDHYVAPRYDGDRVEDETLLNQLELQPTRYILLNLGGGIQEKLGVYLKKRLSYQPGILCTGAAIAFMTGKQAPIPPIVDRLYLGWLLRCLHDPRKFVPRYLGGFSLLPLIWKNKVKTS